MKYSEEHVTSQAKNLQDEISKRAKACTEVKDKLDKLQKQCSHKWERHIKAHSAGLKCKICKKVNVIWGSICYSFWDCKHPPMELTEEQWAKYGI
jgi:hypothetical protein